MWFFFVFLFFIEIHSQTIEAVTKLPHRIIFMVLTLKFPILISLNFAFWKISSFSREKTFAIYEISWFSRKKTFAFMQKSDLRFRVFYKKREKRESFCSRKFLLLKYCNVWLHHNHILRSTFCESTKFENILGWLVSMTRIITSYVCCKSSLIYNQNQELTYLKCFFTNLWKVAIGS